MNWSSTAQRPTPASAARPRVLLVDDDPDSLMALEAVLEPLDVELVKATSGEQALQILSTGDAYALILLDVRMKGLDGYETASLLRQNERTRSIPVIFLTSFAQDEEAVKTGYAHGAVDFLPKPFPSNLLRWKVAAFIELFLARGGGAPGGEKATSWEEAAPGREHADPALASGLQEHSTDEAKSSSVDQLLRTLFEQTLPRYGGGAVSLYLLEPSAKRLELVQAFGYPEALRRKWRHVAMSWRLPLTEAVREAKPRWPSSRRAGTEPSAPGVLSPIEAAALPLLSGEGVLGVLGISLYRPQALQEEEQKALLTATAHACAQAIEQEWLEEGLLERTPSRSASQRLQRLTEASQSLRMAGQDLASLAQAITAEVVRHMSDGSALRLWSEADRRLECLSLSHVNPIAQEELSQRLVGPSNHPAALHLSLMSTGQSLFMPVVSAEELLAQALPEHRPVLERYPIYSWMVVPLMAHGRVVGTLDAVRHAPGWPFSLEDLRLLEEFASIAALTLEEARSLREQPIQDALRQQLEFEQKLVGIVSHDLRTPLGAIVTAAGLLQATPGLDERQRKAVHRILSSSDRATRLIRDFLDFTQAHLGQGLPLKLQRMDLHEVIRDAVSEVQQISPGLQVSVEQSGDGLGMCDPDRLAQVVTNLMNNALAYSAPGTHVGVRSSATADAFLLEVHNQGKAIPQELQPRLFDPLTRGAHFASSLSRNIGLGLFIVREIVRGHGGRIEVTSSQEAGTTFTVRLPRH